MPSTAPAHRARFAATRGRVLVLIAGLTSVPPTLGAQTAWQRSLCPYLYYSAVDGWWAGAHIGVTSPAQFERPEPTAAALGLDISRSSAGSYAVVADARAPAWWPGWRVAVTLGAARDNRLGFDGLGNATSFVPESVAAAPTFYDVSRTRAFVRATLARRIVGPVRLVVSAGLEQTTLRALPGSSVFARDLTSGADGASSAPVTDRTVRGGVVLDTRDNELDPHAGVLMQGFLGTGTGYTRADVAAQAYVNPTNRLVLAGRVWGEGLGGAPALAPELTMDTGEEEVVALGGYSTLRGYYDARFVGPGKLLGGLEARYAIVRVPSVVELKIVAFYDAGRVFVSGEPWVLADLHHAAGGELALRFLRDALVVAGVGAGADGTRFVFGTRWSY